MPRARSPNRDKAFKLWIESQGQRELKDIAAELDVSPEQVRKWKNQDDWDGQTRKVTLPNGKGNVTKRKPGAPRGNKNAVGHRSSSPPGNQNALKHGAYAKMMLELLDEDEAEVFKDETTGTDIEAELRQTLNTLNLQELRLMRHIKKVMDSSSKSGQVVSGADITTSTVEVGKFTKDEKGRLVNKKGKDYFGGTVAETTTKHTTAATEVLARLESELDRVQARKTKILTQLQNIQVQRERLKLERKRLDGESEQSKMARAWIAALTGEEVEDDEDGDDD